MLNKIYCDLLTVRCIPQLYLPPNYKLATSNAGWRLGVSSQCYVSNGNKVPVVCRKGNSRNVAVLRLRL